MKNKLMVVGLVLGLFAPVFAAGFAGQEKSVEQRGEFLKAQQELRAKMKATDEKMGKLVKEYQKLKGKKQEAKKAEITAEVKAIRQEQLKFKQEQLDKFAKRLEEMKKQLSDASTDEAQKAWVDEKTEALINADGDMKVLFDRPNREMRGPKAHKAGHHKRGFFKGKKGPKPGEEVGINPPPPPPAVEK